MSKIEQVKDILKREGLRVTRPRLGVAKILIQKRGQFLSSEEIFLEVSASKDFDCDQASVYRTLTKFEELGIVAKSSFNGEAARFQFALSGHRPRSHEHYFKCFDCGEIEALNDCLVAKKERELESKGYRSLSHHLEIVGLCPQCAGH